MLANRFADAMSLNTIILKWFGVMTVEKKLRIDSNMFANGNDKRS